MRVARKAKCRQKQKAGYNQHASHFELKIKLPKLDSFLPILIHSMNPGKADGMRAHIVASLQMVGVTHQR